MNASVQLKWCGRIILLVVFASLLSINALAQDESEPKSPLEVKLTTQMTAFCVGTPLKLELEVANNGQKEITINKSELWTGFSYGRLGLKADGINSGGMEITGDWSRKNLILHPGEFYHDTFELELPSDFFNRAGRYSLKTRLNHIFSNDVEFELYDCGKPQEVKEQ